MLRTLFFSLSLLLSLAASAQLEFDAKLNVGSLVTGGINVAADFVINPHLSVSAGLGGSRTRFTINETEYRYGRLRLIPEVRYYVSPKFGADRFFAGAYGKMGPVTARLNGDVGDRRGFRGAIGVLLGYKIVKESGFVLEFNAGVGRANVWSKNDIFDASVTLFSGLDLRLGILAGYRF